MTAGARVIPWAGSRPPAETDLREVLAREGLSPYRWGNGPGDQYAPHSHPYDKVIYVVEGSIAFGLPDTGERLDLSAGDRLELSRGTSHDACVGSVGVVCLEAHR